TEGFYDGEDDGPAQGIQLQLFEVTANLGVSATYEDRQTIEMLVDAMSLPGPKSAGLVKRKAANQWNLIAKRNEVYRIELTGGELRAWSPAYGDAAELLAGMRVDFVAGLNDGMISPALGRLFASKGFDLSADTHVETLEADKSW